MRGEALLVVSEAIFEHGPFMCNSHARPHSALEAECLKSVQSPWQSLHEVCSSGISAASGGMDLKLMGTLHATGQ